MLPVPSEQRDIIKFANDVIGACRVSAGMRAAYYRQLNNIVETGKLGDGMSLINLLYSHLDRLASHLYSPIDLRFTVDFKHTYPTKIATQADVAAKALTRDWEDNSTDILFGQGVFEALKYGACILKQWTENESDADDEEAIPQSSLVMPWQFAVFREDVNSIDKQEALCETTMLTLPEVWKRIHHLPEAKRLYQQVKSNASKGQGSDEYNSFFHSVLSTSQIATSNTSLTRPTPGGMVQLNQDPTRANMGPVTEVDMVKMHELWVKDQDDYVTIQLIEPDILIAPLYKKSNLLVPNGKSKLQPYRLIQPNQAHGYFWGRTELMDLIQPQALLSETADDARRLIGLQVDKIIGFSGADGLTDELYGQMRGAGWISSPAGSTITDLTPAMPPQLLQILEFMIRIINMVGGFDNILSGQNEPGVRSGIQNNIMMKTAAPRIRDRALIVERQVAAAGDLRLSLMGAKDGNYFWTDGSSEQAILDTRFIVADLPDDRRVKVDSHSTSPIFADDHQNVVAFGLKSGIVDGEYAIEELPFPHKDKAKDRLRKRQEAQARQMEELKKSDPEEWARLIEKSAGGGRRR